MLKIESLNDYTKKISSNEFLTLATNIYNITNFICNDYQKYKEWYFTKQLPGITTKERNILFIRNPKNYAEIISVAFLKKDKEERKICTLYVSEKYRGLGIGSLMIEESLKWLETTKPLITLADYKLNMFTPFIKKYNWELTEIIEGLYNNNSKELCFNGTLTKTKKESLKRTLHKRLINSLNHRKNNLENNI